MIETVFETAVAVVIGVTVLMNIIGPLIIWKTRKLPAIVKFQPLDDNSFMEERNTRFKEYDRSLIELGFEVIGSSILQDSQTNAYFRLFWNPALKVAAMIVTMKSAVEEMTYLEYSQAYNDETAMSVSNSPRPEAYPELDMRRSFRFPKLSSAAELLAVHGKLKDSLKKSVLPVDYDTEKGFYEVEDYLRRESDALLEKGIVSSSIDQDGKRSLTLYGAFALTWRSVPPGKTIWGYLTQRRAEQALENAL